MVRLVLRWLDSPWAFELLPGLNKLGRNPTNDFRVSDPSVSSFHAEITLENDVVRVQDLGSTNGTFVNDHKVTESILKPEDILRLGNVRLALQEVSVTPVCKVPAAEPAAAAPVPAAPAVDLAPACAYHGDKRAAYRCENCGGCFCLDCTTIVGQGRFAATTVCPMCKGQCYALPNNSPERPQGLLVRLTQTLKLPFSR
jgi:hypothetical protein